MTYNVHLGFAYIVETLRPAGDGRGLGRGALGRVTLLGPGGAAGDRVGGHAGLLPDDGVRLVGPEQGVGGLGQVTHRHRLVVRLGGVRCGGLIVNKVIEPSKRS